MTIRTGRRWRVPAWLLMLGAAIAAATGLPAQAQTAADPGRVKAKDIVTSPLADVNLMRRDIPPALQSALADAYDLNGIRTCAGFITAIRDLDAVLGDDIDIVQETSDEDKMGNTAGSVAKTVIGSFIPFRGLVRELSGANAKEREWQRALYAGTARRSFLKGMGQQRKCAYPARAATPQMAATVAEQRRQEKLAGKARADSDEQAAVAPDGTSDQPNAAAEPLPESR